MKKLFSLFVILTIAVTVMADRAYLVGHRGCRWAVENTKEAFELACTRADYDYLECDVKVTKDKKFIISHDDDVSRFNSSSSATIAGTTLANLQKIKLTQTRGGTTYTGYLCSLDEYLDICKKYGKRPVIELKYATGINNGDQSNIPALVNAIEAKGFRNTCIILTSMKTCLEYLHKNYPDIKLQFLTGQYWESHFDWCVANGIDVDIQTGSWLTKTVVDKYHKTGLKVNIWTVNTPANYDKYFAMGVDYMTVDYLERKDWDDGVTEWETKAYPETESGSTPTTPTTPSTSTEDYVDVLVDSDITPATSYTFRSEYTDYTIAELTGKTIRRVIARNNLLYILAVDANKAPTILVVNPTTKAITQVSTTGMATNHAEAAYQYICSDIAVTTCGHLIATNYAKVIQATTTTEKNTFWKWENDANGLPTGNPVEWLKTQTAGNWSTGYAGGTFAYTGDLKNGIIYGAGTTVATSQKTRITLTPVENGVPKAYSGSHWHHAYLQYNGGDITLPTLGDDYHFTLSPNADCFTITGSNDTYTLAEVKYTYTADMHQKAVSASAELPASLGISKAITHVGFFKYAGATYCAIPSATGVQMIDVTDGISNATKVTTTGTTLSSVSGVNAAVGQVIATKDGAGKILRGDIELFLLRGDKLTYLTTAEEKTSTPTEDYVDILDGSSITPASRYEFHQEYVDHAISELTGKTIRRVISHNNLIYILAVDAAKAPTILVFNPTTKAVTKVVTTGMATTASGEWAYACSDIAITTCGHLIASNLATVVFDTETDVVTFYKWANDDAGLPTGNPTTWIEAHAAGNWGTGYGGETFTYTGTLQNGTLYYSGETTGSSQKTRFVMVPVVNGVAQNYENSVWYHAKPYVNDAEVTGTDLGGDFRFTLSPNQDNIIITGETSTYTLAEYAFTKALHKTNITTYNEIPASLGISSAITHIGFFKYASAVYCAIPSATGVQMIDVTDGINSAALVETTGTTLGSVSGVHAAVGQIAITKDASDVITRGDIELFLLRGDKATLLSTRDKEGSTTTSIKEILEEDAPIVYYTLTGIQVPADNLTPGIYIRKQGAKTTKVMIR